MAKWKHITLVESICLPGISYLSRLCLVVSTLLRLMLSEVVVSAQAAAVGSGLERSRPLMSEVIVSAQASVVGSGRERSGR